MLKLIFSIEMKVSMQFYDTLFIVKTSKNIHDDAIDLRGACIYLFLRGKELNVLLKKKPK